MSLTQIIIGLIIIVLLLIGLIVFVSKVVFQYKKHKMENEMEGCNMYATKSRLHS